MNPTKFHPATIAVHGGLNQDEQFGSVVPPIYPSSTFNFPEYGKPRAHDYSRRGNPGRDMAQDTLAALEGGAGCALTSSGLSALYLLTVALLTPNDLLVAPHDCYGGSYRMFALLSQQGLIRVMFADYNDEKSLSNALDRSPKLVLIETPSNPLMRVTDIAAVAARAHEKGAWVAADNTFMTPIWQRPLDLGCDFVVHSCTKYLNGHSDLIAGCVISKTEEHTTLLAHWANVIGIPAGAFDSYWLMRGLRTLATRMAQHDQNAKKIVAYLRQQKKVSKIYHPSEPSHPQHELARQQQSAFGAMVSFELSGDPATFVNALSLFTLAESLGGTESLIAHPSTMTHAGMPLFAQKKAGIHPSLLRLSVGLEHIDDLIADLDRGFAAI
ncbi:MAG: cystathionine gamma-synthase [Burkholderiales bacterium]|jgi:cystathionine gamma-synthase|nr:cystathionine gamma-synthase [Burkholderiales bacterium]